MAVRGLVALCLVASVAGRTEITHAPEENPELSACGADSGLCLVRSSWEVLRHPFGAARPVDASLAAAEGLDLSVLGRRFSLLEEWDRVDGVGFLVGNEFGDQVLQEVPHGSSSENRNPATCLRFSSPDPLALEVFGRLEQVDHFSDAGLARRAAILGFPTPGALSPWRRHAWFGENLPAYSLAGGGARWSGPKSEVGLSYLQGWIWQHLPLSDLLVPWRIEQIDAQAAWKSIRWRHVERRMVREDTTGTLHASRGELAIALPGAGLEGGFTYSRTDLSGPSDSPTLALGPWIRHRFEREGVRWSGFHRLDQTSHLSRDTLGWTGIIRGSSLEAALTAQLSNRPDAVQPELETSLTGRVQTATRAEESVFGGLVRVSRQIGPFALEMRQRPWLVDRPRAFQADSFDLSGRRGKTIALDGILYGWEQAGNARCPIADVAVAEFGLTQSLQAGQAADQVDLVPSKWSMRVSVRAGDSSGLSIRASLGWRSEAIVRHHSSSAWKVAPRWNLETVVEQSLFDDRVFLSMALLDLLAQDRSEFPDGGQRRPRLLVSGTWQL